MILALLLALSACGGGAEGSQAEQLALELRGAYLALEGCTASIEVTADYGQRVYQFEMDAQVQGEDAVLTLTAPETVAGLTARWAGEAGTLEYDGVAVETGSLDPEGLDPVSAFPVLLEAARSGYLTACALEEDGAVLRVDCGDPAGTPGQGTETTLWFDCGTHARLRGEIRVDGFRVIGCTCLEFTRG